jgi:arylsulfatase A-like enzyme
MPQFISRAFRPVWLIAVLTCSDGPSAGTAPPPPITARLPNIIFILSDDEDVASHAFLPKSKALLQDQGTTLSNFFVTYSLCCPSRASILRGQYPHNTKVESNALPSGGYLRFQNLGRERETIATWLSRAGYRTILVGKYMNGYEVGTAGAAPPGWDGWNTALGNQGAQGFNYSLDENGRFVTYGSAPADFFTDVLARKAVAAIHQAALDSVPLFLYLAPFSPHLPAAFAPRHAGLFGTTPLPISPNYNEADVSDKPLVIRSLPLLGATASSDLTGVYQNRLRALQSVDDLVDSVVTALQDEHLLNKTWIFYTSDNGFHMGAHRSRLGKNLPYEEDLRVPFVVRGPGVPAGRVVNLLALNIDLAATFATIAHASPLVPQDGRSLVPLLSGAGSTAWRQSFQAERSAEDTTSIFMAAGAMHPQLELGDAAERFPGIGWNAIRTARWKYVEWGTGERELYDLGGDPYEMTNLLFSGGDTTAVPALQTRLHQLMTCAGPRCSEVEDLPVP